MITAQTKTLETETVACFLQRYKEIINSESFKHPAREKVVNIALLTSFTSKPIPEILTVKCVQSGIIPNIYHGNYNQYHQEILNKNSQLYQSKPDLVILFIDTRTALQNHYFSPYQITGKGRHQWIEKIQEEIETLISKIKKYSKAKIVVHNFEIPVYSPFGILESKQKFGFFETIQTLNHQLQYKFKNDSRVFIFNYDAFCSEIGKSNIIDYKMYYLADLKFNLQYIPNLCDEYLAYIKPLKALTRKCLVLDLDDTLWGGIVGEDGFDRILLGPTAEGLPFVEFQKHILALHERGVILAINSQNNFEEAIKVIREHPHMILREKHFASMKINWISKIINMQAIATELSLGIDSLVMVDDNPSNREILKDHFPELLVVDMPKDPSLYSQALMKLNDFNSFQMTKEDENKGKLYQTDHKRHELKKEFGSDLNQYLQKLGIIVTIENIAIKNIPRISQLIQKTNQFNMTTKRYMEEDLEKMMSNKQFLIVSVKTKDKFGENGIVGVGIIKKNPSAWRVDSLLLSCRVIGRKIEDCLLTYIFKQAQKAGILKIIGEFIETKKNVPAKDFYRKKGFKLINAENGHQLWQKAVQKTSFQYPSAIKIVEVS